MTLNKYLQKHLDKYKGENIVYDYLVRYFEKNTAARKYAEVCEENAWDFIIDHLTIRTYKIDEAAKRYAALGWKYDTTIEYKNEGWWAKVYRRSGHPCMFIDQSYDNAPPDKLILKQWVDKFGDKDFHHLAFRLPQDIEIEESIDLLKKKEVNFPGKVTGPKGTRLRQIFSQAEVVDGLPFSVIELAQRNKDKDGKVYEGFISEQADSLMKDSVL